MWGSSCERRSSDTSPTIGSAATISHIATATPMRGFRARGPRAAGVRVLAASMNPLPRNGLGLEPPELRTEVAQHPERDRRIVLREAEERLAGQPHHVELL